MNYLDEIIKEMEDVTEAEICIMNEEADTLGCGGLIFGGGSCGKSVN